MTRLALITGITGQDGSYLAELLVSKGYEVHGLTRAPNGPRARELEQIAGEASGGGIVLHKGDLTEEERLSWLVADLQPDEVYNLAGQSHIAASFESPLETLDVNARGCLCLLEAVRDLSGRKPVRFFQASSSELFGAARQAPQDETTPFRPRNPYACAKAYAFFQTVNYREAYGLFACNGILYNHESPRRDPRYVTRKITLAAAAISAGLESSLRLGNLDAKRDWGYAKEYVEAMWLMLQADEPDDYVVATGTSHTVQDVLEIAFARAGLDWRDHVTQDPELLRPTEVCNLRGDFAKAKARLGWNPRTLLPELVTMMVDADLARFGRRADRPGVATAAPGGEVSSPAALSSGRPRHGGRRHE